MTKRIPLLWNTFILYLILYTHHPKKLDQTFHEYENTLVNSG